MINLLKWRNWKDAVIKLGLIFLVTILALLVVSLVWLASYLFSQPELFQISAVIILILAWPALDLAFGA